MESLRQVCICSISCAFKPRETYLVFLCFFLGPQKPYLLEPRRTRTWATVGEVNDTFASILLQVPEHHPRESFWRSTLLSTICPWVGVVQKFKTVAWRHSHSFTSWMMLAGACICASTDIKVPVGWLWIGIHCCVKSGVLSIKAVIFRIR